MAIEPQLQQQLPSPFLSIWVKPRGTIRNIIETDPTKYVTVLAMIAGLGEALNWASSRNLGDSIPLAVLLILCVLLGPVGGLVSLYIGGALYRWSGSWLGGKASSEEVRAAIAWSFVPTIFTMPLWIPELLIFGEETFTSSTPRMDANPFLAWVLIGFAVIKLIGVTWAFVVLLKTLGEVHRFSAWKAYGALFLGSMVILVLILVILGVFIGLGSL